MTRTAISPRLAIRIFCSTGANVGRMETLGPCSERGSENSAARAGVRRRVARRAEVAETGSTNADLLALCSTLPDRTVLRADHQTAGRGRLDRRWDAPPGSNLLVSLLFREVPADPGELMRRVALAAVDAPCARSSAGSAASKWPNDVLLDGRKLAGILAQRAADGSVVVVGSG